MENARELFEHELKDMYDAELRLVKALKKMAKETGDEDLAAGFEEHRQVTETQVSRLEEVFALIDKKPVKHLCPGVKGLVEEYAGFVKDEEPEAEIHDLFASRAALKVEHYEMVAYKSLIDLAKLCGLDDAVSLLEESLQEEEETAEKLEEMSKNLGERLSMAGVAD